MTAPSTQPPIRPLPPVPSRTWWRRFTGPSHVCPEAIKTLRSMGYDRSAARRVLSRTGNNLPAAIKILEGEREPELEPEGRAGGERADSRARHRRERADWTSSSDSCTTYSSSASCSTRSEATPTPGLVEYLDESEPSRPSGMSAVSGTSACSRLASPSGISGSSVTSSPQSYTGTSASSSSTWSKRRWFSSIGPLILPPKSTRNRHMRYASSAACPGGSEAESRVATPTSPTAPALVTSTSTSSSSNTVGKANANRSANSNANSTATLVSNSNPDSYASTNSAKRPPLATLTSSPSMRRRWPLHLSKERPPRETQPQNRPQPQAHTQTLPQAQVPDAGERGSWVHVTTPRTAQGDAHGRVSGNGGGNEQSDAGSAARHSIHGGPIIAPSTLRRTGPGSDYDDTALPPSAAAPKTVPPGKQHKQQQKHNQNNHPYSQGYKAFPKAKVTTLPTMPSFPNRSLYASTTYGYGSGQLRLQHPFAASMTQCNMYPALWEEASDSGSDSGTFGIKAPTEWAWDGESGDGDGNGEGDGDGDSDGVRDDAEDRDDDGGGDHTETVLYTPDGDDEDDDDYFYDDDDDADAGVDVQAWRANMSTLW